jgi:hypothetical protein
MGSLIDEKNAGLCLTMGFEHHRQPTEELCIGICQARATTPIFEANTKVERMEIVCDKE